MQEGDKEDKSVTYSRHTTQGTSQHNEQDEEESNENDEKSQFVSGFVDWVDGDPQNRDLTMDKGQEWSQQAVDEYNDKLVESLWRTGIELEIVRDAKSTTTTTASTTKHKHSGPIITLTNSLTTFARVIKDVEIKT
jgi:photosystem II stability/assembly factor-like uncharacterized protein